MKKTIKYSLSLVALAMTGWLGSCTSQTIEAPELPDLPTVNNLTATVNNRVVTLNWQLPSSSLEVVGASVTINNGQEVFYEGPVTTCNIYGQPMEYENLYTVKLNYKGGYKSQGQSVMAMVPYEELPEVSNLVVSNIQERDVTLTWTLPDVAGITGVYVGVDGEDPTKFAFYEGAITTVTLTKQPTGVTLRYRVLVQYDGYYASAGNTCPADIPYVPIKMGYLLLANSPEELEDDDEYAAATWFASQDQSYFVTIDEIADLDPEDMPVLWIMVDRIGLPYGWEYLPDGLVDASTIAALKGYLLAGGNLYLSKMACQMVVPLDIVSADFGPTENGSGEGGEGGDVWTINPYLGWDFRPGGDREGEEDFYDRTAHQIFAGLLFADPNGYGYESIPLEGPGWREDHNCIWDCNRFGKGDFNNVIKYFETQTNAVVLATWGHVRDHCIAGLVEFLPDLTRGTVIANGFAAYEFEQNSGTNPYQDNIYKLTDNILNYLK